MKENHMAINWDMRTIFLAGLAVAWILLSLGGCRTWQGHAQYPDGSSLDVEINHFLSNTEIGELDVETTTGAKMSIKQLSTSERLTAMLEKIVGVLQGALAEADTNDSGEPQ